MSMTREEASVLLKMMFAFWANTHERTNVEMEMALNLALTALRPVSREQVERMRRGEWKHYLPPLGAGDVQCRCTRCGRTPDVETPFCAWCGAPMTDEAVEMVMERLEALKDGSTTD